jgi:malate dehydrogenase (oxaloacetate-decarboxylating)(NADP+)
MADNPVIFAMANPDPEITPEEAHEVRVDAIVATGRSDYPNQVNNVLGFPICFAARLDIHARAINDQMKIACAEALATLAREDVPDEVAMAYGRKLSFGRDYIIPTPFDPRLIYTIPPAVARAGMDTGVSRRPIIDLDAYAKTLKRADGPDQFDPAGDLCPRPQRAGADDLCRGRRCARVCAPPWPISGTVWARRWSSGARRM